MTKLKLDNESEIVSAFRSGNESALSYFLKLYYTGLCIFAEKKVGMRSIAEDIVEEAFIKAWKKRSDFDSIPAMKSFLYVVVRNACLNYLKKQQKDRFHNRAFAYLQSNSQDHLEVIRAEVLAAVYNAIENLPEKCQHIFRMSYLEGIKNEQIADTLSLSVQTVKNQKVRAVKLLQMHFKGKEHLLHMAISGVICLH